MLYKNTKIKVFPDVCSLNSSTATFIVAAARQAVHKRGRFIVVLSGGETPNAIYEALAQPPFVTKMPWHQTFFFWGDERCVPLDDKNNNAHNAKMLMLDKVPVPVSNIFPIPVDLVPSEAAQTYEKTIDAFFEGKPYFDLVLLGLGENGHTASLFPNTPVLNEHAAAVRAVFVAEGGLMRISMTAPLLNLGRQILFTVVGKKKAGVLEKVLDGPFNPECYPAQLIKAIKGNVIWHVDKAVKP